jgi:outer membrane protein TolC
MTKIVINASFGWNTGLALILVTMMFVALPVYSETVSGAANLEKLTLTVLANSPVIHQTEAALQKAKANLDQCKTGYFPDLDKLQPNASGEIRANMQLFSFGQLATVKAAEADLKSALAASRETQERIVADIRRAESDLNTSCDKIDAAKLHERSRKKPWTRLPSITRAA